MHRDDLLLILLPVVGVVLLGAFAIFLSRDHSLALPETPAYPEVREIAQPQTGTVSPPTARHSPTQSDRQFPAFGIQDINPDAILTSALPALKTLGVFRGEKDSESLLLASTPTRSEIAYWYFPLTESEARFLPAGAPVTSIAVLQRAKQLFAVTAAPPFLLSSTLPGLTALAPPSEDEALASEFKPSDIALLSAGPHILIVGDQQIRVFANESGDFVGSFPPQVDRIATVLSDSFSQVLYISDGAGRSSRTNPGGAVRTYRSDGQPFMKNGSNRLPLENHVGGTIEGMSLFPCLQAADTETGSGFLIIIDRQDEGSELEFFNRETWYHLGTLRLENFVGGSGITGSGGPLAGYPEGFIAVSSATGTVAIYDWRTLSRITGLTCSTEQNQS